MSQKKDRDKMNPIKIAALLWEGGGDAARAGGSVRRCFLLPPRNHTTRLTSLSCLKMNSAQYLSTCKYYKR